MKVPLILKDYNVTFKAEAEEINVHFRPMKHILVSSITWFGASEASAEKGHNTPGSGQHAHGDVRGPSHFEFVAVEKQQKAS